MSIKKGILVLTFLLFFCSSLLFGCDKNNTGIVTLPQSSEYGSEIPTLQSEPVKISDISSENIIVGNSAEYDGWNLSIEGYSVQKELTGEDEELCNDYVKQERERWISEGYEEVFYVIVEFRMENLEASERTNVFLRTLSLVDASDPDALLNKNSFSLTSYIPTKFPPEHTLYYWRDFAPQEIVKMKLLYIVPDLALEKQKFLFCFCVDGISLDSVVETGLKTPFFVLEE